MRRADPQFEREKAKYEHPLPSREYILETLAAQGAPLEFERLARLLDIQAFELEPVSYTHLTLPTNREV